MAIAHRACRATLLSWESDANSTCELLCQPKLYSLTMSLLQMPPFLPATSSLAHEDGPDLLASMRTKCVRMQSRYGQVWPEMVAEMTKDSRVHGLFYVISSLSSAAGTIRARASDRDGRLG